MTTHQINPRLTIRDGGWVLILMALVCTALVAWAVAPAVMRKVSAPPGDGRDIDSYAFDLSNLAVSRDLITPVLLHRDMLPHWDQPPTYAGSDITQVNADRGAQHLSKYLVGSDRVIGVIINDQPRAYPISVMYVHEIINDTLGGEAIAVTYNWLTDTPRVFARDAATMLRASGLVCNGNMLMYDDGASESGETVWMQMSGAAMAGPRLGETLTQHASIQTSWADWLERHPETEVIQADPSLYKRYRKATPSAYFRSDDLPYAVSPIAPSEQVGLKQRIIAVPLNSGWRIYPVEVLLSAADDQNTFRDAEGNLRFIVDRETRTARLVNEAGQPDSRAWTGFWFAWYAIHSDASFTIAPG